jgi:hypothetical protein
MKMSHRLIAVSIVAIVTGCTGDIDGGGPPAPTLLALSTNQIAMGQPIDFYGGDFLNDTVDGHSEVRFKGQFVSDQGHTYAVDYRFEPLYNDGNHVVWPFVGPYQNPFSGPGGDQLGMFTGTVTAINVTGKDKNRVEAESPPLPATLRFGPSIIIKDFQPLDAQCDQPAERVLGGFPYKVTVEAIGFTPVNFSYMIVGEAGQQTAQVFRQIATGQTDMFGLNGEFSFSPVPDGQPFYLADFAVAATDTGGVEHQMQLTIGVHRPIEYIDSGIAQIAQVEAAAPDSGCLSGGETVGSTVTYMQSHTDTRTRTLGLTWDENWLTSVSNEKGGASTVTNGINWNNTHTDMQGWVFGWNVGTSVTGGGKVELGPIAEASLEVTVEGGIHSDHSWGFSDSRSVGGDHSQSDTESWATTNTTSHSIAKGSSDFWAVSSADSKALNFTGLVLPHRYGVFYRQTTRIAIPGSVVAYNLCGTPQVVADADFFDYQWSLELAQGDTCSPLPKSHLPEAQCLMSPCGN